ARRAEEARRAAAAKSAADAQAAAEARRAAEQHARSEREAELRRQMAEEEHVSAVESGPLADQYRLSLENRIIHAWLKPPSARLGIDCRVEVTQVPGGEVVGARVTQCNGDASVRQSIENAVYRASPLPEPPDPALFHRTFVFEFKPQ
ncbi:MAG: cell envelope integrity protein TolA, partial [Steroidobacteraceae bacterium]